MIPKVIHYCWFGHKPLPKLAKKCIASWTKFLPDYEIKEWNEGNFNVNGIPYTRDAYKAKKYAFVSDYARFWILYNYGGLYFDTDVEIIRPLDDIIMKGPFMGCELNAVEKRTGGLSVAPGLGLGANPGLGLYKEILESYVSFEFLNENGDFNEKTIVSYTTEFLQRHGLKNINQIQECAGVWIYPKEFFCPLFGRSNDFSKNTRSIHHYMGSWKKRSLRKKLIMLIHKTIILYQKVKIAINI